MNYFFLEPYVAGGIGENSVIETPGPRPVISQLNFEIEDWAGDVLLRGFPCFVVTQEAMETLKTFAFTGSEYDVVEITVSHEFSQSDPHINLPNFAWFKIVGKPGYDDFGTAADSRLVISERALEVFNKLGIPNAIVKPYETA